MKFFARYISKAAIIIQKNENLDEDFRYKFCFDNLTIGMKNAISNNYDKQNNIALEFITEGDFQNKAVFLETSRIQIDVILSLISLSTIRYCSPVQLTNVTEVIDNKDRFPTAYYVDLFNDDTTREIIHFFDPVIFEEIFTQFNSYQDVNLILRSITWFRKGLNEEYINKFVTFWFGLEVLKEIPSTIELSKSNIDNKWKKVETIFENYLKIQDFYHIKNDLKEKLFDGTHELDMSFKEEIEKYLPVLQKALLIGILMELRINGDIIDKIIKFIRAEDDQRNLYLVLIGELEKFPQSLDNLMDDFPIIEMKTKHTVAPTISQNFKTYYFNGEYLFSNFKDNQFNLSERQLWSKQRPTELEKTFSSIRLKDSKSDTLKVSFDTGKHKTNNYEKSVIFKPWMKTLNEGKAAGKISYLFLADRENERENLQLFGGLCYSPAGHILFYPGFEYEYLTKFDDSLQISSKSTYIIDHFTLLKGASKWHVTGFDETGEKKHKFGLC